jgi:hypothetical protein
LRTLVAFVTLPRVNSNKSPDLVSKRRAASMLDVTAVEIDSLVRRGILETRKVGRRRLLVYASLKAFCAGTVSKGRSPVTVRRETRHRLEAVAV